MPVVKREKSSAAQSFLPWIPTVVTVLGAIVVAIASRKSDYSRAFTKE